MLINFLRGNISIGDDHGDEFDNFEFGSDHFTDEDGDEWNNEEDDWDDDVHDEWWEEKKISRALFFVVNIIF